MNILSREAALSIFFCLPSEKQSTLKGNILLPRGKIHPFLSFYKGPGRQKSKQEVTKVVPCKTWQKFYL